HLSLFFLYCSGTPPDLPSFPTRRSSDLRPLSQLRRPARAKGRDARGNDGVRPAAAGGARERDYRRVVRRRRPSVHRRAAGETRRSEEHTSELQSLRHLVCRLLLEKKKKS